LSEEDSPEYNEKTTKQKKKEKIGIGKIEAKLKKGKTEDTSFPADQSHSDSIIFDSGREKTEILEVPKLQNAKNKQSKSSNKNSGFDSYMENSESNANSNEPSIQKDNLKLIRNTMSGSDSEESSIDKQPVQIQKEKTIDQKDAKNQKLGGLG